MTHNASETLLNVYLLNWKFPRFFDSLFRYCPHTILISPYSLRKVGTQLGMCNTSLYTSCSQCRWTYVEQWVCLRPKVILYYYILVEKVNRKNVLSLTIIIYIYGKITTCWFEWSFFWRKQLWLIVIIKYT